MDDLHFEWDAGKAASNLRKHKVSFAEAVTVFYDDTAIEFYDDGHGAGEERFLLLGLSARGRLLLICHCYRAEEAVVRIISARRATANEAKHYPG